jgi:glycerophosphoryl diester phosphodiesterase
LRYLDTPIPRLFAHRGASGRVPENTLEAFRAGLEAGADLLELDVHATRDGDVVVIHDESLERTTDCRGLVRQRSTAEVRAADAGYSFMDDRGDRPFAGRGLRVPLLAEVLAAFASTPLNIEIKQSDPAIEAAVVELLDRHHARDRVLLAAESDGIMQRIRAAASDVLTGFSAAEVLDFYTRVERDDFADYHPVGRALQVPHFHGDIEVVTPQFVRRAHEHGLEVHVWTINDEAEMLALAGLGVDGLMSDLPDVLSAAIVR